jgi:hypothetical protein
MILFTSFFSRNEILLPRKFDEETQQNVIIPTIEPFHILT